MLAVTTLKPMLAMSTSKTVQRDAYHHGDLRRGLIAVASQIVASKGPAAVSLREVARLAGVSHNAPYRHFESRDELLFAVAAQGFRELGRQLKAAAEGEPSFEQLRAHGRAYLRFALANRGLYLLMFGADIDKAKSQELEEASRTAFAELEAGIAARGLFDPVASATAAWAFVHGLAHLIIDRQVELTKSEIDSVFAATADVFIRMPAPPKKRASTKR